MNHSLTMSLLSVMKVYLANSCIPSYLVVSWLQATAEQIRLAQMIYDKNDADFEDKVNQVRNTFSDVISQTIRGLVTRSHSSITQQT